MPVQQAVTVTLTLTIYGPLSVTTQSLPDGQVGQPYSFQMVATGGETPYTWDDLDGATPPNHTLPTGLSISSGGLISGTPTVGGAVSVKLNVHDAES